MTNTIILTGEDGAELKISSLQIKKDSFSAFAEIKTHWCHAKIKFYSSIERLKEFESHLEKILSGEEKNTTLFFINEDGNFEINIEYDQLTEAAEISGVLIENMLIDACIKYSFSTNRSGLDVLLEQLSSL